MGEMRAANSRHVTRMGEMRAANNISVGGTKKTALERRKQQQEDYIEM
jgi:hypothetical protein